MGKRVFDVLVSALGLLLIAPLLLLLAAAVKLDSPGPVFFRQLRVGRHGVPFRIHKFRTMRVDAEEQLAKLRAALSCAIFLLWSPIGVIAPVVRSSRNRSDFSTDTYCETIAQLLSGEKSFTAQPPPLTSAIIRFEAGSRGFIR